MKNRSLVYYFGALPLLFFNSSLFAGEPLDQQLDVIERAIAEQEAELEQQKQELHRLREQMKDRALQKNSTAVDGSSGQPVKNSEATGNAAPDIQPPIKFVDTDEMEQWRGAGQEPVGLAPTEKRESKSSLMSLPDQARGVLTQAGKLIVEPGFQYSKSQVNRLTFRGVELDNFLLIGPFEAENVDREFLSTSLTARYGLTNRIELEAKVPWVWRDDDQTGSIPSVTPGESIDIERSQKSNGLGDIELAAHYQINQGLNGWPFFIGNLRYKSRTGDGPFDVSFDASTGIEEDLPTGSGFHAIEPSVTILYPSEPAVLFANVGYLFSLEDDVDKTILTSTVDKVDPGNTFRLSFGMAYSVNERLSLTLGYKQDTIESTKSTINGVKTKSSDLDIGALLVGFGYQVNNRLGVNINLEIGATDDAPDSQITVRIPYRFDLF